MNSSLDGLIDEFTQMRNLVESQLLSNWKFRFTNLETIPNSETAERLPAADGVSLKRRKTSDSDLSSNNLSLETTSFVQ